jgi:hypothetical protein
MQNAQMLADTLVRTGVVSSCQAMMMAQSILGTEQRVAKSQPVSVSTKPLRTTGMSYQEEIDYLIKKTNPEYKDYHIPIRGYKRDSHVEPSYLKVEAVQEQKVDSIPEIQIKLESAPEVKVEIQSDVLKDERPISELMNAPDVKITVKESEDFIIPLENSKTAEEPMFREMKVDKKPH